MDFYVALYIPSRKVCSYKKLTQKHVQFSIQTEHQLISMLASKIKWVLDQSKALTLATMFTLGQNTTLKRTCLKKISTRKIYKYNPSKVFLEVLW